LLKTIKTVKNIIKNNQNQKVLQKTNKTWSYRKNSNNIKKSTTNTKNYQRCLLNKIILWFKKEFEIIPSLVLAL